MCNILIKIILRITYMYIVLEYVNITYKNLLIFLNPGKILIFFFPGKRENKSTEIPTRVFPGITLLVLANELKFQNINFHL